MPIQKERVRDEINTGRLETFSDAVIAVIITVMVLELKPPAGVNLQDLLPMIPLFLAYILSFISLGIYWNNHHHLLHVTKRISGKVMWANLHLLFWISLIPFATAWIGGHPFEKIPVILYGVIALFSALAYLLLSRTIIKANRDLPFEEAFGDDRKGNISFIFYILGIIVAFFSPVFAYAFYTMVAIMWFIPDRRLNRVHDHS